MGDGEHYYCIGVSEDISTDGEIYFTADIVEISHSGDVIAYGKNWLVNFSIPRGKWNYLHSASVIGGGPCSNIEHWQWPEG